LHVNIRWYIIIARGRGEQIRLALSEADIPFVEKIADDPSINLGTLRADGTAIFGSLPILKYNGLTLAQGCSIVQYVASKGGFAGNTDEQRAEVMQYVLAAEDARIAAVGVIFYGKPKEDFNTDKYFGAFSRLLGDKEYFVGDVFTAADLAIFDVIDMVGLYVYYSNFEYLYLNFHVYL
jgi:glutathione S-transferase